MIDIFKKKKVIIFDLDGTLIDSINIWNEVDEKAVMTLSDNKIHPKNIGEFRDEVLANCSSSDIYLEYCEALKNKYNLKQTPKEILDFRWDLSDYYVKNKIDYNARNVNVKVLTDSKWLEFILGQIINNCIKYKRDIAGSYIKISVRDEKNKTTLIVEDNGIGIKESDLKQVFNKTFTGENGRTKGKSTGMGLFIAKNMCDKLGHKIEIESALNKYTRVYISFAKDKYYEVLK